MERLLRICSLIVSWFKTIFTNHCRLKQNKYSRLWIGLRFHSYVSVCFSVGWVALLLVRPGWRTVRRSPPFWGIFLFWEWRFVKNFRYDSCLLPFLKHVWTEMEFYWEFNWNTLNSSDWFFFGKMYRQLGLWRISTTMHASRFVHDFIWFHFWLINYCLRR